MMKSVGPPKRFWGFFCVENLSKWIEGHRVWEQVNFWVMCLRTLIIRLKVVHIYGLNKRCGLAAVLIWNAAVLGFLQFHSLKGVCKSEFKFLAPVFENIFTCSHFFELATIKFCIANNTPSYHT